MTLVLTDLFGDSDKCRIIGVFVENPECAFLMTEVMCLADVKSYITTHKHITELICNDIVMLYNHDRDINMYKLNCNNKVARILALLESAMMSEWFGRLIEECD